MTKWCRKLLDILRSPALDWIQVEVTSHCDGCCTYCPNPLIAQKRHMPLSMFDRLLPYILYTDLVYLQGWGEPLLNPDFFDMVRRCKSRGRRVGFTTNGMHLSDDSIQKIIDLDVDIICISLAGTAAATHNRIRRGTDFSEIVTGMDRLQQMKANAGAVKPAVHFAFVLLMQNYREVKNIVRLSKTLGVKEVVASHLTLIVRNTLSSEALFNHPDKRQTFIDMFEDVKEEARQHDISFAYHSPVAKDHFVPCREDVRAACFVSVDGTVSPCVFTSATLSRSGAGREEGAMTHVFNSRTHLLSPMTFGNIQTQSLTSIWNQRAYIAFREYFHPAGEEAFMAGRVTPSQCRHCYKGLGV